MMLQITFVTLEKFHIFSLEIEKHFDTLTKFVTTGHEILSACLIDQLGYRTELPLEAFNGVPMGDSLLKLEKEYLYILKTSHLSLNYISKSITQCEALVSMVTEKINDIEKRQRALVDTTDEIFARLEAIQMKVHAYKVG